MQVMQQENTLTEVEDQAMKQHEPDDVAVEDNEDELDWGEGESHPESQRSNLTSKNNSKKDQRSMSQEQEAQKNNILDSPIHK